MTAAGIFHTIDLDFESCEAGAVWLLYVLGYDMSAAVWVGLIALLGVDAEPGVFMLRSFTAQCSGVEHGDQAREYALTYAGAATPARFLPSASGASARSRSGTTPAHTGRA